MQIEIDSDSGFCYGVVKTIQLAEDTLKEGGPVYCLGEIVHNEEEVERLKSAGLIIINREDLKNIKNSKVLIRAHGEAPETYKRITAQSNTLKEGTCPIVLQLQKKIHAAFEEMKNTGGQVVIYGKKDHAEVIGLRGQTDNTAIIISNENDLDQINFSKPIALFAQTTQSLDGFEEISNAIGQHMLKHFPLNRVPLKITDSICRHVAKRGEHLARFSQKFDVIVFVSGTNSSNGKVLFETCRQKNPNTYWVPNADKVKREWFLNARSVGICGATSTPRWLMEKVAKQINTLTCK
jgi:4-hydroxy-3-methylbut-2-en-1-yl diphosphate reductase